MIQQCASICIIHFAQNREENVFFLDESQISFKQKANSSDFLSLLNLTLMLPMNKKRKGILGKGYASIRQLIWL